MPSPRAVVSSRLLLAAVLAGASSAQIAVDHAAVVTRLASGTTALLDVDLKTGQFTQLGRFPSDAIPPRALTIDPVRAEIVLAVDRTGGSRLLRLAYRGATLLFERTIADLPGSVTALGVTDDADVFATLGGPSGGVWRVPRTGSAPARVAAIANASALFGYGLGAPHAWIAESGTSQPVDPQARLLDLRSGQTASGPHVFTGFTPNLTGIGELITALVRVVVTDDLGRISLSVNWATPVPLQTSPVLPAGGTRRLRVVGYQSFVLGSQASPYIRSITGWNGPLTWTTHAGPLPGDPVDFEIGQSGVASVVEFGLPCGTPTPSLHAPSGVPKLGNASFALACETQVANALAILVLGGSDLAIGPVPLPVPVPGGCLLRVSPDVVGGMVADARGSAVWPLPIPGSPALSGVVLFAQWLVPTPPSGALRASSAAALHVWP